MDKRLHEIGMQFFHNGERGAAYGILGRMEAFAVNDDRKTGMRMLAIRAKRRARQGIKTDLAGRVIRVQTRCK